MSMVSRARYGYTEDVKILQAGADVNVVNNGREKASFLGLYMLVLILQQHITPAIFFLYCISFFYSFSASLGF